MDFQHIDWCVHNYAGLKFPKTMEEIPAYSTDDRFISTIIHAIQQRFPMYRVQIVTPGFMQKTPSGEWEADKYRVQIIQPISGLKDRYIMTQSTNSIALGLCTVFLELMGALPEESP